MTKHLLRCAGQIGRNGFKAPQLDFVSNLALFSGVGAQVMNAFFEEGDICFYSAKDYLFREGDPVKYFYIVCSGTVREFRKKPKGGEITLNIHGPGGAFCLSELFLKEGLHYKDAASVEDACVIRLPIQSFKNNLQKFEIVRERIIFSLAQLIFMKQVEIERRGTLTAPQIITSFLRQTCKDHGLNPRGFKLPYSKSLIASRLGIELETLSRAFQKLKEQGITITGNYVRFGSVSDEEYS